MVVRDEQRDDLISELRCGGVELSRGIEHTPIATLMGDGNRQHCVAKQESGVRGFGKAKRRPTFKRR
jgi:hypothetical protein